MLKKRLIACLLWRDGMVVQSINFKHTNVIGNAITAVDFFNAWAVDEIVILDVARGEHEREIFYDIIKDLSKRCFVPLSVGGWVTTIDDIRTLLQKGADKVIINSEAFRNNKFVTEASQVFGAQWVLISIDAKKNEQGDYEVFIEQGKTATGKTPIEWAKEAEELGAGEIFLTSIDHDGKRNGFDLELTKQVSEAVDIPVIASGGVGKWDDLVDGITQGKADAVSAANIFHFMEHSTKLAKEFMHDAGLDVRQTTFYKIDAPRNPKYNVYGFQ